MEFLPIMSDGKRVYAGFWPRFCSVWVDFFVLFPLGLLLFWLESLDKNVAILITIPSTALFAMYHVYFNARFGGTPGKLAVGIRVAKPDGTKIGWLEAWKRSSVDIGFALLTLCIEVWALTQVNGEQYSAAAFTKRMHLLQSYYPSWFYIVTIAQNVWIWSEVVVLLLNKRKRALHDFIAGTVVIHKEFAGFVPKSVSQVEKGECSCCHKFIPSNLLIKGEMDKVLCAECFLAEAGKK
jgi:uncharacterized RDD family membrane protein YckC